MAVTGNVSCVHLPVDVTQETLEGGPGQRGEKPHRDGGGRRDPPQ